MVAGLDARKVGFVALALALLVVPRAQGTIEAGRAQFKAHQAALQAQQEAAAKGDRAAYEAKGNEAQERLREARAAYEHGKAPSSNDPALLREYVRVLEALTYYDLAAETIERAVDRGVEDAVLLRIRGECLMKVSPAHFPDAVDALRASLALDDSSADAADTWFALGGYYLDSAIPNEAMKSFEAALAIDASHIPARLGNAAAKVYAGEVGAAGDIIEAVGRDAQPYDVLLRAMMRDALYDFDNTRRTLEDTAANHYAFARLLYLAARFPEAVLAARRATDLDPDNVDLWNFLGAVQLQTGDYEGSQGAYEASLRLNPEQPQIKETVERLKEAQAEAAKQQQEQAPAQDGQGALQGQGPLR